jgi:hypothetical protein
VARPAARRVFLVSFLLLACAWGSGSPLFAQARVGAGPVAVPRVPPVVVAPRIVPLRPFYPFRPFFPVLLPPGSPVLLPPGVGPFGAPPFSVRLGLSPYWGPISGFYPGLGWPVYYPLYIYAAAARNLAQLCLNDGTAYSVTDYWVVDGQLHFITVEEDGTKTVEHTIDFKELNLQKTIDVNESRGFRFVLRDEPFEEYLRDHPGGVPDTPPAVSPSSPQTPR